MGIKDLRELTGLSQSAFAEKYHLNKYTLQGWEQGQRECPEAILELIKDVMGFSNRDDEGVHDLDFWMHYGEYDTQFSILRKEGFSRDKSGWMIRNNKVWFSDVDSFVESQKDLYVAYVVDGDGPACDFDDYDEYDEREALQDKYACGCGNFLKLAKALKQGKPIYRDNTYNGLFNPNEDLGLEIEELDFDIPYVLEITE